MAGEQIWVADKPTLDAVKADTNTIKSEVATIKGYTDTLETSLGVGADAPSAVGSVHAKLKDIKANLGGGTASALNVATAIIYSTTPGYVLDVSGSGKLHHATSFVGAGATARLKVIVDGTIVFDTSFSGTGNNLGGIIGVNYMSSLNQSVTALCTRNASTLDFMTPSTDYKGVYPQVAQQFAKSILLATPIEFKTSLRIEHTQPGLTSGVCSLALYELT